MTERKASMILAIVFIAGLVVLLLVSRNPDAGRDAPTHLPEETVEETISGAAESVVPEAEPGTEENG